MVKNALLSIKKNIGKSILLFIIMAVIANLVIAGLSIKSATTKSMEQIRSTLGNDVTLSYNMQNMMKNREKGESMDSVIQSITIDDANQIAKLDYVENVNYTSQVNASSEDIDAVEMSESSESDFGGFGPDGDDRQPMMDDYDFTIVGNTTMAYLSDFVNENSVLTDGRLLNEEDTDTQNCVVEKNLAEENDLSVGDKFKMTTTVNDEDVEKELTIVGIYEVQSTEQMGAMMSNRQNPVNQIYTSLSLAQSMSSSETDITSATYYIDDPENIDAFKELAQEKTDIDFETYTLDANDSTYQRSISSLENMSSFATLFLGVVIAAGSVVLCLVLVLTLRSRFYEFGVLLSLGQSKIKIILQQFFEIGFIALLAFTVSLGTGKMVSNVVSGMLESAQNSGNEVMMEMPDSDGEDDFGQGPGEDERSGKDMFGQAMQTPENTELDVSMTSKTVAQLAGITAAICAVSILLPSVYILRLSPREILIKKEG